MIADIQAAVAREYRLPLGVMRERSGSGTRIPARSHPRQTAMALASLLTRHSSRRIGDFFGGRDRTTVMHACRAVAERRKADPELDATMRRVTMELVGTI